MNVLKHPVVTPIDSVRLESRSDGVIGRYLEQAMVEENHVANLEFDDQLLNFALERFHRIGFENSLPIAFNQGLPFHGVKRGREDFPGHRLLDVGEHLSALF